MSFACQNSQKITTFIDRIMSITKEFDRFKNYLREFLLTLSEFAADNDELYLEEREQQQLQQKQEAVAKAKAIPGMLAQNLVDMDD